MSSHIKAITDLPNIAELVRQADFKARKSLGQNFIFDLELTSRIARAAKPFADIVFEIGPGPGGLTRGLLLEGASSVIAIEKDNRAIGFLDHLLIASQGRLEIIEADALCQPIWDHGKGTRQIVANLPYNIATPLLLLWLGHGPAFTSLVLMFQREVALRLVARPGTSAYGRLSVITQWFAIPEILFDVPPEAFVPPPSVTSSVVKITPREKPLMACQQQDLELVTSIGFGQRRKMLRASFKHYGGAELLEKADIDPALRPQDLSVEQFCHLAILFRKYGLTSQKT